MATTTSETGTFGALLRQHRLAASLSQEQLGERAQLSVNAIAALERGRRTAPRPSTVVLLANALSLTSADRAALISAAAGTRLIGLPKPVGLSLPPGMLPSLSAPMTNFIGHEHEIAELRRLLRSTRLITLTGVGGIGKTRLALQVVSAPSQTWVDGVWLVELAPVKDQALVPQTVAAALGIRERPDQPVLHTLANALASRRTLLLLDNCEQVIAACAPLAEHLLRVIPGLTIMATSREPLNIAGEVVWRVSPLPTGEAADLFAERASAARPGLPMTAQQRTSVVQLCELLDGLPLAIELAAAAVKFMTVEDIAARLDQRLRVLGTGSRTAPARHQTLRAMVDWSHALLSAEEQQLFRQLSVFAGGCTLEAIEATCGGAGDVLPLLGGLVDKSLVTVDEQPYGTRYQMLETLRQYSVEKLRDCGDEWPMRTRHLTWCLDLAERGEQALWQAQQTEWLRRLQHEQENFRAALGWSIIEPEQLQAGLRLATALPRLWWWNGYLKEGTDWLSKLLETAPYGAERARALGAAAFLWLRQDNAAVAKPMVDEALMLARQLGDQSLLATALLNAGQVRRLEGDAAGAEAALDEGLALARSLEGPPPGYYFLLHLGLTMEALRQPEQALACYEDGIREARLSQDQNFVARLLRFRGNLLLERGDLRASRVDLEESLKLSRDTGPVPVGSVLTLMAGLAAEQREYFRAVTLAGAAVGLTRALHHSLQAVDLATMERRLEPVRQALDRSRYERVLADGVAMDLEKAIAYALDGSLATTPATESRSPQRFGGLSRRECEVAQLIGPGFTNRQIAATLVISERTVARHVENILAKLDLSNRTQVARWAVDRELGQAT